MTFNIFKALTIDQSKNVVMRGIMVKNSEKFQISIMYSQGIRVEGVTITTPFNSPNTVGIHIQTTSGASIINSTMATGDDCMSLGTGDINIWIENIRCGPGHSIAIDSLGETPRKSIVENVTVSSVVLTGTENGLRIKTWANPYNGFVSGINFQHAIMKNVRNPIIIDQNYCPNHHNCSKQSSGIKINGVVFDDVWWSSATAMAVTFDYCSRSNPCSGIELRNVRLTYDGEDKAEAFCRNVEGGSSGLVIPPSCI
ncbi:polygalacturonase-like [Phalaenopsis equestris]|uniref:polygalacturonase-like n=1 Tax=Phalaenopsis equestris TaxID=78828 RepID=UPI0009E34336|nr:polygalacturonase-like [Phalaenopsis equestris]